MPGKPRGRFWEALFSVMVFSLLVFYTYGYFVELSYPGFIFSIPNGIVLKLFVQPESEQNLMVGDRIVKLGAVEWSGIVNRKSHPPFQKYQPGDTINVTVLREGEQLVIPWRMPGPNWGEILDRLLSSTLLILSYAFWIAGTITLLYVQPPNERRNLLAAFDFITAIWIITGYISAQNVFFASAVFHAALWLTVPITWHLNWVFVKPVKMIQPAVWASLYLIFGIVAILDVAHILPGNPYPIAAILAPIGSVIILTLHWITQPENRRQITIIITGFCIAVIPGLLFLAVNLDEYYPPWIEVLPFWFLILIPITYFYAINYRQLGGLTLRTSRTISLIIFGMILFLSGYIFLIAFATYTHSIIIHLSAILSTVLSTGILTAIFFPRISHWIESRFLGMPIPPRHILETYIAQITTMLDTETLVQLIRDQIFPSLLIRQGALFRIQTNQVPGEAPGLNMIFSMGVGNEQLPQPAELPGLLAQAGHYLPPPQNPFSAATAWVRLSLAKQTDQNWQVLCLLGQRDPDDYYAPTELQTLQALIDNTTLALVNIEQTHLLHSLYQNDIERHEAERTRLALELHDDVLGQLALMAQYTDDIQENQAFMDALQASVRGVREIVSGLRPPLLNYGLGVALNGLIDDVAQLTGNEIAIEINIPSSSDRYPPEVELHLYRIIQQACVNAIQHSQAQNIFLQGHLSPDQVDLTVEDDGIGFQSRGPLNLSWLLAKKHFGLAGMYERAELIGAHLFLSSKPGKGTTVRVVWEKKPAPALLAIPQVSGITRIS
jgi:signal transduction histidine kinase